MWSCGVRLGAGATSCSVMRNRSAIRNDKLPSEVVPRQHPGRRPQPRNTAAKGRATMPFPSDLEIASQASPEAPRRDRRRRRDPGRDAGALRRRRGQGEPGRGRGHGRRRTAPGPLRRGVGHHPHPARRGQDHHHRRAGPGLPAHRAQRHHRHPPAVDGPHLRHQGRRGRGRLQPGGAHGAVQPPPHRRHARRDPRPTTCARPWSTPTSTTATRPASTSTTSRGAGCST